MPIVFPTSPTVGQVFTESGRSWVWSGSTWDSPSATNTLLAPYGLELVKSQEVGVAVTSVTVTNAFGADYDNYRIVYSGTTTSNGEALRLRYGSTTTGYSGNMIYTSYAGSAVTAVADNNISYHSHVGGGAAGRVNCTLEVFSPFLSVPTGTASLIYTDGANGGSGRWFLNNSTSYTDFTLLVGSGTITGGTISVYGYRKA